ncbi:glycoside hydrolase family 15 protein [Algimonas porphyrae]|uniref:Glucoamylase n=1 Tax=Algimonas porphyrae TaxID=1128113 RepID=A0ABQ5UZG6_9PROT|nr:glycoside hydrolase family 15 protein [Algimonas porphyrae]GLQ19829.1 glucoamylase [Algimonas porphyrae]
MSAARASNLDFGVIGNCRIAALIDSRGDYQWLCLPRLDGDPVLNALLGGEGRFSITLSDLADTEQCYLRNTAVLRTVLTDANGAQIEIVDFAPRFRSRGRMFRPAQIVRLIRPLSGLPQIAVQLSPSEGFNNQSMPSSRGVSHVRYGEGSDALRVTTNAPIDHLISGHSFAIDRELVFILGPDTTIPEDPIHLAREWEQETIDYWRNWVHAMATPPDWQEAVIRAAITLQLCVYEETGGIVAALTTSIPEHDHCERNWDYRYCWIRDSYFTVTALNRCASMGALEHYLRFLRSVVAMTDQDGPDSGHVQPLFGIGLETNITEHIEDALPGYKGNRPVRRGNQAYEHIQHDVYGQIVLAATPAFFDQRLHSAYGEAEFRALEPIGERAFRVHDTSDAGIWEFREIAHVHTSSAIMCWAACDRLSRIANHIGLAERASYWAERAAIIHATVCERGFDANKNAFTMAYGVEDLDASVLLMAEIGFLPASDPRYIGTVDAVDRELRVGNHVFRYKAEDDFGKPKTAFTVCTFWHLDALWRIGRRDEARAMFETVLRQANHLGLLSEDLHPETGELWGNFPQTYSMAGIINSAFLMSRDWPDVV